MTITPDLITNFWLNLDELTYWRKDPTFDDELKQRFADILLHVKQGQYDHWANTATGALALVILLDQTARNIHRDSPEMYDGDDKALTIAKTAIANGFDQQLPIKARRWFYLPFMHSEQLADQQKCVELCKTLAMPETEKAAAEHYDIISRFGRFPHRNAILGRPSTEPELAFLADGGFAG